ncbi:hypothetical protein C4J81_10815 [Deltaproteobacteria bacterium Smac51]|nr:hypothetical protein C4J81_10815 [Deltaproteobacteria bacterium Smac51]
MFKSPNKEAMVESLIVRVDDIPLEGLELELNVPAADLMELLAEDGEETPVILSPLTGSLKLRTTGKDRLSIKGGFAVTAEIFCDRCLNETPTALSSEVNEVLDLEAPGASANGDEESDSDGSLEVVDGKVNLSGLLGELFWLSWPWHFICKPDCAGLCSRCGANLNEGLCGCVDGCGHS